MTSTPAAVLTNTTTTNSGVPPRVLLADGAIDLRLGDWREVLGDVAACAAVITDPPYTSRVEFGYRSGSAVKRGRATTARRPTIPYGAMTTREARAIADFSVRTSARFAVVFNDHVGWRWLERAFKARGRYVFAPVIWDKMTPAPRFQGDGPTDAVEHVMISMPDEDSACEWICVSRPRERHYVGSLDGIYRCPSVSQGIGKGEGRGLTGQKPLALMMKIVEHYTKPGDLVVDMYCGRGTTAVACALTGRRCVTSEISAENFALAQKRIIEDLARVNLEARQLRAFETQRIRDEGKRQRRAKATDLFAAGAK